ncbi:MAG: ECF transporter S component [Oscillospiraceae bacterium]
MANTKIRKLVWAALFTALTTVATMVIQVPSPTGGYINAGDALVILGAFFLGPVWGALAAGLGSALADVFAGYILYAPATLIIKGLMALTAGAILRSAQKKNHLAFAVLGSISAEAIMIFGYFLFTATFLGVGMGALAEIPGNCVQAVFGATAGTALFFALSRIPYVKNAF